MGNLLHKKKVGIIGFGRIGRSVADLLTPFNVEIAFYDVNQPLPPFPGVQKTMDDLLQWADGRLLLLLFGDANPQALRRLQAISETTPLRAVQVVGTGSHGDAVEHVLDPHGHLQGACHVFGHAWALVRPDSYVAATGESIDSTLVHAIGMSLGLHEELKRPQGDVYSVRHGAEPGSLEATETA